MLLAIHKEIIAVLYIKGYCSKIIINTNFLIIRAVYIAVNGKYSSFLLLNSSALNQSFKLTLILGFSC